MVYDRLRRRKLLFFILNWWRLPTWLVSSSTQVMSCNRKVFYWMTLLTFELSGPMGVNYEGISCCVYILLHASHDIKKFIVKFIIAKDDAVQRRKGTYGNKFRLVSVDEVFMGFSRYLLPWTDTCLLLNQVKSIFIHCLRKSTSNLAKVDHSGVFLIW